MTAPAAMQEDALGRSQVVKLQRARLLAAIVELVAERGLAAVTVAHITGRSRVSRRTFYELFADRGDCLAAAFEQALQRAAATVVPVYRAATRAAGAPPLGSAGAIADRANSRDPWAAGTRAGLAALLGFLDAEPAWGHLLVVDALAADSRVLARRAAAIAVLIDAVHRGGASNADGRPPRIAAEGAVGAVFAVIHARMCEPAGKPLSDLLGPLMAMLVLPYRGAEAAERERRHRAPRSLRAHLPSAADPLQELDMRLTYRTLRVLQALAELDGCGPGPSSRAVADAAGISDQGQISKLLWRLAHLGLVVNALDHPGRGAANAWRLTARGREVECAVRAQAAS